MCKENSTETQCAECGMSVETGEYHPYAACLMFKGCHNSKTVNMNLLTLRTPAPIDNVEREKALEAYRYVDVICQTNIHYGGKLGLSLRTIKLAIQQPQLDVLREKVGGMRMEEAIREPEGARIDANNDLVDEVLALIGECENGS